MPADHLPLIVFDDSAPTLAPLTDLRASFDVRTGAATTLERIERVFRQPAGLVVHPRLAELTRERHSSPRRAVNEDIASTIDLSKGARVVCGRCVLPAPQHDLAPGCGVFEGDDLVEAVLSRAAARKLIDHPGEAPSAKVALRTESQTLIARPWHVRGLRDQAILADLPRTRDDRRKTPESCTLIGDGALQIESGVKIYPGVILDLEHGPITLDEGCTLRPACTVIGPAYIGRHVTVLDRALIKGNTAIGPWCKVAGEVGGTIFQGFSNKAHDGHLGDSWVGEWVNLGAGTTNSNLLNTYGEVLCRAFGAGGGVGPLERSGQQFLGAVLGDHVKTAICTRMMTGCIVGTGTMWAAASAVAGTVPAFSWVTDSAKPGEKKYAWAKFEEVLSAAMGRRRLEPSAAYLRALRDLSRA